MSLVLALVALVLVATVVLDERRYQRKVQRARRRWENEIDRRTR